MYKILKNECISENIYLMEVETNKLKNALPGEFVVVMNDEKGEKIPLTIVDVNDTVLTLIYQVVGASTYLLAQNQDSLYSILGPLGNHSKFVDIDVLNKKYLLIAGGIGIAPLYPQAKYLKEHGAKVTIIYGAKNKDLFILEDKLNDVCDEIRYITDDGSNGNKGFVTDEVEKLDNDYYEAIVIGPMIMMKNTCESLKKKGIKSTVSLNPIMVDGTGMCGACRVIVDGEIKFACVDGPEFDGELVDFDNAIKRMNLYKTEEGRAYLKVKEGNTHHGGCGNCGE